MRMPYEILSLYSFHIVYKCTSEGLLWAIYSCIYAFYIVHMHNCANICKTSISMKINYRLNAIDIDQYPVQLEHSCSLLPGRQISNYSVDYKTVRTCYSYAHSSISLYKLNEQLLYQRHRGKVSRFRPVLLNCVAIPEFAQH